MSCQLSRFPIQPKYMPISTMIGGTAVTTPLAIRSTRGIDTGRTLVAGRVGRFVDPKFFSEWWFL